MTDEPDAPDAPKQPEERDEAAAKGAVEDETSRSGRDAGNPGQGGSLTGQLGHRDQDELLKANDTDFPEPDAEPEHSGSAGTK